VAKKPGHRGEHVISRKTIAQGRLGISGEPVVTTLVWFFNSHARLRVRTARPASLRPLFQREGHGSQTSGAIRVARTRSVVLKIELAQA